MSFYATFPALKLLSSISMTRLPNLRVEQQMLIQVIGNKILQKLYRLG